MSYYKRISQTVGPAVFLLCFQSSAGWTTCTRYHRLLDHRPVALSSVASDFDAVASVPAAGIPRELEELALFESLDCDENSAAPVGPNSDRRRKVERVSMDPPIFILRNAISPDECHHIRTVASAMEAQMEDGRTVSDADVVNEDPAPQEEQARKHSRVGWLENDRPAIEAIARRAHGVFLNGMPFHATRGIEPLQVVHYYGEGGEYVNHHDGNGRLLTVLYYLNGVGATWFPLAGIETCAKEGDRDKEIRDLLEARRACVDISPGQNGVLVTCRSDMDEDVEESGNESRSAVARVNEGDAVAFYSYRVDGSMNWKAFHSGLPVTKDDLLTGRSDSDKGGNDSSGGKWIANHFYHFVPSHIPETPPPKPE